MFRHSIFVSLAFSSADAVFRTAEATFFFHLGTPFLTRAADF